MTERNFNAYCHQDGIDFEEAVIKHEVINGASLLARNINILDSGVEMDMIFELTCQGGKAYKFIQAKGGKPGKDKRPGARRTDNVKKAIADGTLLKCAFPESWYTVYFSAQPKEGSNSDRMIRKALENGIIDEVQYLSYPAV